MQSSVMCVCVWTELVDDGDIWVLCDIPAHCHSVPTMALQVTAVITSLVFFIFKLRVLSEVLYCVEDAYNYMGKSSQSYGR